MAIKKIGVLGAGTMGHGIALVSAKSGYDVIIRDIEERFVQNGIASIDRFLARSVAKGRMTEEEKAEVMARIGTTVDMEDLRDCDLGNEAIIEKAE